MEYFFMGLIIFLIAFFVFTYNRLVLLKNRVEESWADIDTQLKRRHDLIPNLVETVKGYASHEKQIFDNVAEARERALTATQKGNPDQIETTENQLMGALKSLFAISENYPDLKASTNFLELQREVRDTEDKIQASRRFYNGNVKAFNVKIATIPYNMIASSLGYSKKPYFEAQTSEKENPQISF